MPTTFNIPQFSIAQGETGSRTSPAIPSNSIGYSLLIQRVGWAFAGGDALKLSLFVSYDNKQTWIKLTEDTIQDVSSAAVIKNGVTMIPADAEKINVSIDPVKNGFARFLRADYEGIKAVTISGTITAL